MKRLPLSLLLFYQKRLSPALKYFFGHACRFTPTCSEYAQQAFGKYSFPRALALSVGRVLRCHPLTPVSYDPLK